MAGQYDWLIRHATVQDGSGAPAYAATVALRDGLIMQIACDGELDTAQAQVETDARGLVLAPGFIDVHTHDDTAVIHEPAMLPKLSQGVTTVIVGNCGISASPVRLRGEVPDPLNLLGDAERFRYPRFADYRAAVEAAHPAVNVAALVGHTALRQNHLDTLDRPASPAEQQAMRAELRDALAHGAIGLSSGLAYASAHAAPADELHALATELAGTNAVYTTHLRTEFDGILDAIDEALHTGRRAAAPVIVSHLKCAGAGNWGRSQTVLDHLSTAAREQPVAFDCYPYAASSSTLDLSQVTKDFAIVITWSNPHPEMAGRTLADIAASWETDLHSAAARLQPAGAIYHGMEETDVQHILAHPLSMIGSDGLPADPLPHPRLWGAFPRVLGHYCRDLKLFDLATAIYKMTGLPAARFGLHGRGLVRVGACADLTLFNSRTIRDTASFTEPIARAEGIAAVWVNGVLSYHHGTATGLRAGRFLARHPRGNPA